MTFQTLTGMTEDQKKALAKTILEYFKKAKPVASMVHSDAFEGYTTDQIKAMRHSLANTGLIQIVNERTRNGAMYETTDAGYQYLTLR